MRLFAMWLLDLNDFAERFLCYSTNLGVWCERSPVPSIPDVFEYAKSDSSVIHTFPTALLGIKSWDNVTQVPVKAGAKHSCSHSGNFSSHNK